MNKRQAKPNGYPRKSDRRAFRGGADDDVQEEESGYHLDQEARCQAILAGAEFAIAVRCKTAGNPVGLAGGNRVENRRRDNGANNL